MILSTSNLYKKELHGLNSHYIQLVNQEHFEESFITYIDENNEEYYAFSPVRARETFANFTDVMVDIPTDYLYISDFYPMYLLEEGHHPSNFRAYKGNDDISQKDKPNYYVKKSEFYSDYIISIDSPLIH